ncbi:hypothetical protein ASF91_22910 [Rhizobium sp. Leaf155]|nr:hypothetical protein ASF91_22910 [Rhizobium sp. Leaf155]
MQRELNGRVALITGAARGIGFAIAERLAVQGAHVIISDIDLAAGEHGVARIVGKGGSSSFAAVDLGQPSDVLRLAEDVRREHARIDILVNNAGVVSTGPVETVELEEFQRLMTIDLTAVFLLTKAFLPDMTASGWGRIINIASIAGQQGGGMFGNSCYAAAKGGVIAFSKGIAREAGRSGVTCNTICPGLTDTALTSTLTDAQREQIISTIPVGRPGEPHDIAGAVGFLASDEASFITGVTLNVDGGFMRY